MKIIKVIQFTLIILLVGHGSIKANPFDPKMISEIPIQEAEALIDLYNNANGQNWIVFTDWLVTYTPGSWFGITAQSGRVNRIELASNNLNGNIVSSIGDFSNLQVLDLSNNIFLTGELPLEIMNLMNLTTLYLDNTNIIIPDAILLSEWFNNLEDKKLPDIPSVPEPASIILFFLGLLGLLGITRRKK